MADRKYTGKRIAVEEGYLTAEMSELGQRHMADPEARSAGWGPGMIRSELARERWELNADLGEKRIAAMDACGLDMQLLVLSYQGTQMLHPDRAVDVSRRNNDALVAAIARYPDRLAGLASLPTQHPEEAAKELDRAVTKLGLKGAVIHSHTRGREWPDRGEYLDEPQFEPLFTAAERLKTPIYLHPSLPSPQMVGPFVTYNMTGPIWGYQTETAVHVLRLIFSGIFDRHPGLTLVIGHLGEGIPFFFDRIDEWYANSHQSRYVSRKPSEYFRSNIYLTTSAMNASPSLQFVYSLLGADRLLFAVDYPQQSTDKEIDGMDKLDASPEEKAKMFHLNAERIFNL